MAEIFKHIVRIKHLFGSLAETDWVKNQFISAKYLTSLYDSFYDAEYHESW